MEIKTDQEKLKMSDVTENFNNLGFVSLKEKS